MSLNKYSLHLAPAAIQSSVSAFRLCAVTLRGCVCVGDLGEEGLLLLQTCVQPLIPAKRTLSKVLDGLKVVFSQLYALL